MIREFYNQRRHETIVICLLLAAIILATFWDVQNYDFVFDDGVYVTSNTYVRQGLTGENIKWAMTTTDAGFWHPITWLSLFLDHDLYNLNAGGYHWTNLLFHMANSILLFLLLNRMTGAIYRSGFVAALFAVHPLHIESVAWISQRKDVLSTFFWMLTMWFYISYVKKQCISKYLIVICVFILGLLSKPMLVTLPFVLLLFDFWPLNRTLLFSNKNVAFLLIEKVPLILISIIIGIITFYSEQKAGAVITLESIPLGLRVTNAIITYAEYIKKMVWPQDLAVFYPYFNTLSASNVFLSVLILTVISSFVANEVKKRRYLAVGWLWYVGTLLPVIGIIQIGSHAMADRYTYIPLIGLFIMIAWGIPELLEHWRYKKIWLTGSTVMIILIFIICSRIQTQVWENGITLFSHAITVTKKNYLAQSNLGVALAEHQDYEGAIFHYKEALKVKPDYAAAHNNLGAALVQRGRSDEAIKHFRAALKSNPNYVSAQRHLADELLKKGDYQEAITFYYKVLHIEPDDPELYNNLGVALAGNKNFTLAARYFSTALRINPDYTEARNNLQTIKGISY